MIPLTIYPRAVERFGQDARRRGLAYATRAGEQVGMVQALLRQRIGQGLHDVLLPRRLGGCAVGAPGQALDRRNRASAGVRLRLPVYNAALTRAFPHGEAARPGQVGEPSSPNRETSAGTPRHPNTQPPAMPCR